MFARIMVPLNGLASAEAAIAPAAAMAHAHGAELHLVLVDGPTRLDPTSAEFQQVDCAAYRDDRMRGIADDLRARLDIAVTTALLTGRVTESLASYAASVHIDLVVMVTHGRVGWRRAWMGSVADDLMHLAATPLLLLREDAGVVATPAPLRRIMVALDGSADAEAALDAATDIARPARATLILVRVVVPVAATVDLAASAGAVLVNAEATQRVVDEAQRYLDGLARAVGAREALHVESRVDVAAGSASPGSALARLAREARVDLVALTTHGRGGSRLLARSVSDRILHDTACALMVCHARMADARVGQRSAMAASHGGNLSGGEYAVA